MAGETREWFQEMGKEVRGGTLYPFFLMRRLQRIFCQELDFQTVEIRLGFVNSDSSSAETGRSSGVFPTLDRLQQHSNTCPTPWAQRRHRSAKRLIEPENILRPMGVAGPHLELGVRTVRLLRCWTCCSKQCEQGRGLASEVLFGDGRVVPLPQELPLGSVYLDQLGGLQAG